MKIGSLTDCIKRNHLEKKHIIFQFTQLIENLTKY